MPIPNQDTSEIKEKILSIFKTRGPSLPVHIARETRLSTLFSSAFLSELISEQKIKISNMKVGNSPLYFIPGQESMLENFSQHLRSKEKEAFILLKEKKFLKDKEQNPAIRVALRQIRDFAIPFKRNDEIFWRYFIVPESEFKIEKPKIKPTKPLQPPIPKKQILSTIPKKINEQIPSQKKIKPKEKSEFVKEIIELLTRENIEILEEKTIKKREFVAKIKINSNIGKLNFLLIAKDKKSITDNDITLAFHQAQLEKIPVFLISKGEINKKAKESLQKYSGLIKFRKL